MEAMKNKGSFKKRTPYTYKEDCFDPHEQQCWITGGDKRQTKPKH